MLDPMLARSDTRPTVLLTGFGPFPGIPDNASAALVRKLVRLARRAFPSVHFVSAVLPTEWRRAPRLVARLHRRYQPMLSLHFGVASGERAIRLEARAENVCRASPDAAGRFAPGSMLCADGPSERRVTIDLAAISDALTVQGFPASISNDAGGYLCNAVLFQSLASTEASFRTAGFVHIPADVSASCFTPEQMVDAALGIVDAALRTSKQRDHAEEKTS